MAPQQNGARKWLFIAAAWCATVTPALSASSGSPGEQVTVQDAPYTVREQVIEPSIGNMSKMELRQTSVSKNITYSDLDLSKEADVTILQDRARQAAWDVCHQAERRAEAALYRSVGVEPDCVTSARQQALADVNRIVADARAGRTSAAR